MKSKPNIDPNRFYVYGHYDLDGNLFYIGKGTARRAWVVADRPIKWNEIANGGYSVKILHDKLTEDDALKIETELITSEKETNDFIVNKRAFMNKIELDYDQLSELFYYDESSPSCLRRKANLTNTIGRVRNYKDKPVGWKSRKGWHTEVNGVNIAVHRIVYLLHNKSIDLNLPIDHINGIPTDNRIENLRQVSVSANGKNRVVRNKTGSSFIHFRESIRKGVDCSAYYIKFDLRGKRVILHFYIKDHGSKEQAFIACKEYKESIRDILLLTGIPERVIDYGC